MLNAHIGHVVLIAPKRGRCGAVMVGALDSGASGPGSSPDGGAFHFVLEQDTLLSRRPSLHPHRCINGY